MTTFRGTVPAVRDTRTLFGQTMALVAVTAGLFALGAYVGRDISYGFGWVCLAGAFACLIGMRFAVRGASAAATGLLVVFGFLMGLACAPTVSYYAATDPQAVWQAGGATALFMAGLGAVGYGTRRDLSALARVSFFALIGLVIFGIILIFVNIPGGSLIYSILGLVIFAGLTVVDFQRLRMSRNMASAPLLAVSIFLDALNVFFFFLRIFARRD
jgi:FtsH-binding integral membrane protein